MNKEMKQVLFAVMRAFVDAGSKGNDHMLHMDEINVSVCKTLHRRKEKEKKNLRAPVGTAVALLKQRRVLFETIDEWGADKIKIRRFKSADERRVFGMTSATVTYLRQNSDAEQYSLKSELVISNLLRHFDVLPAEKEPVIVPAVLAETVAAIKQEETKPMAASKPAPAPSSKDNVRRLIATVRNRSETWNSSAGTPADLLGAMCALYFDTKDGDKIPASAQKLEFSWHNYTHCRDFLQQHGLIENFAERRNPYNKSKKKAHGIRLTPLGLDVAVDGEFKDERQTQSEKSSPMLKNHKTRPEPAPALSNLDAGQLASLNEKMQSMQDKLDRQELEIAALRAGAPVEQEPAVPQRATSVQYGEMDTISIVLMSVIPNLVDAIKELLSDKYGVDATDVNARGLYLAITEIEKTIYGIKAYISECLHHRTPVDVQLLLRYANEYYAAAKELKTKRQLPLVGDDMKTKSVLRRSEAIEHPLWRRSTPARV